MTTLHNLYHRHTMKSRSILFCLLFVFTMLLKGYGQNYRGNDDYAPPSPNAFALFSAVNTSINLYTGSANINLPITSIAGRHLSVPVNLNYNASGIKVQDVPGWVGTGWSLDAGGVISRVVRGLPDEDVNGFCGTNNIGEKAYESLTGTYVTKVANREWDSEPDLFYFNFLGHTGKFILDEQGVPVLLPYKNLKIVPGICTATPGAWTIVDENGVKYTFGRSEISSYAVTGETSRSFVSSWYLTEIKTPNDDDVITFSYALGTVIGYTYYVQEEVRQVYQSSQVLGPNCLTKSPTLKNKNVIVTVGAPVYLSSISSVLGKIKFYLSGRQDFLLGGMKLSRITVEDADGIVVNSFNLEYGYFSSDGCNVEVCKRLRLDAIFKSGDNIHQKLYSFQYNDLNLPPRYSHSIDHWGYYNANSYTSKIPSVQDNFEPCPGTYYPAADRNPDTTRCKANILNKIYDAKGGSTEFIYSAHQYSDDGSTNKFAGGVRIRIVKKCAGTDCNATYYYYKKFNTNVSSGHIAALPVYHFRSRASSSVATNEYLVVTSNSLKDLFNVDGFHIGYGCVTEKVQGLGYTQTTFTDDQSNADVRPHQFAFYSRTDGSEFATLNDIPSDYFPYTPNTTKSFERGLILQKDIYTQDNALVKQETFNYNFNDSYKVRDIPSFRIAKYSYDIIYTFYLLGENKHISKPYVLTSSIVKIYDQQTPGIPGSNESKSVTQSTEYSYIQVDPPGNSIIALDLLPRKVTQQLPTGERIITENKYVRDYSLAIVPTQADSRGIYYMQQKHIDNIPIESISYIERYENNTFVKYLISGIINRYKEFPSASQRVYPWESWKLKTNGSMSFTTFGWSKIVGQEFSFTMANFKLYNTFADYDNYGNLLSVLGSDGIPNVMTYGHNNSLVVSSVQNPGNYQHQVQYLHKPLIGVLQQTDANLNTTNYEYNNFSELKLVKDESGNILERYSNNVKNQLPSSSVANLGLSVTGSKTTNSTLTFSVNQLISDFGTTTYSWDFGDGTSGSGRTAAKTYAQAGTYRVIATANNARYGIAKAVVTIVIQ